MLTTAQADHFRTFGFTVLPGFVTDCGAALRAEAGAAIRDAYIATHDERVIDGISGHYLPMAARLTPVSASLVCDDPRFIDAAEQLLGGPVIPECPEGVLYFAEASWHDDDGIGVRGVKFAAYFDELNADSGALRLVPGSHHREQNTRLAGYRNRQMPVRSDAEAAAYQASIPGYVAATTAGDVIAFDLHTWHASLGGRDRLAWAAVQLGGTVISARPLRGGMSSAVHLLTAQDGAGQRRQAVLRRYVRPEVNAEEPDIAAREARALRVAGSAGVPTPALLAVDPGGTAAGVPAVLMSRLPGRVDWWPSDTGRWLQHLARLLPAIHAAPLPPPGTIGPFAPYPQASYQPPAWARYPAVWERAAEISHGPAPRLPAVLVHRDFHPGNVLWRRGRVSGVVDWQAACTGPAVADVAHCR